ncbi:MAG: hypothetical protein IKL18_01375 [Oscillospiraceae bacterium]|nr:hypothetical protein [Oscillospiraceae bacterium]
MKKLVILALVLALLVSGCGKEPEEIVPEVPEVSDVPEISESESSEPALEEEPKEEPPEKIQTEISEEDYAWEKFIEQMAKHSYTREEIESLETLGFSREEITAMTWVDVARGLGMVRFGFEREEVESALEILKNPDLMDESFVAVGDITTRIELIDEFVAAVEKGEAAFVHGTAVGEPLYLYFELSYEPGGMIEYTMISEHRVAKEEFSEVYDTEAFYSFRNGEKAFSLPKVELWPGEQLKFSPRFDVPDMPVTLYDAKKIAREAMLSFYGHSKVYEKDVWKFFDSKGITLLKDCSEFADEYFKNLEPVCEGIFDVAGKPHYLIYFYEGENFVGEGYYVCADESEVVFGVSMVDGRLMPIAPDSKPRIVLESE